MTRLRIVAIGGALAVGALAAVLLDAARLRAARDAARHAAVVELVGTSDLALSSSARWLRHPSQAEPGAPFSDAPASLDVDPAGAWIGPPRRLLEVGALEVRRR
ncbi:MAG TPA: hypothetical protein VIL20_14990 [Sandaracinaceae bacterium]